MLKLKKMFQKYLRPVVVSYEEKYQKSVLEELNGLHDRKKQLEEELALARSNTYLKVTPEQMDQIEELLAVHERLVDQRNKLRVKLIKFNPTMMKIVENEYILMRDLAQLKEAEHILKLCESDLLYLEGEDKRARGQRRLLIRLYEMIRWVIKAICIFAIVSAWPMTKLLTSDTYNGQSEQVLMIMAGVMVTIGLVVGGKYLLERALAANEATIKDIVKYIRKIKVRQIHTQHELKSGLDKYNTVTISDIEIQYNRYQKNKHYLEHYSEVNRRVHEQEEEILAQLAQYGVTAFGEVREWLKTAKSGQAQFAVKNYSLTIQDLDKKIKGLEEEISA